MSSLSGSRTHACASLPPLLVGADSAVEGAGFAALFDALSAACPNLKDVSPVSRAQSLRFRLSVFRVGGLALASKSSESYAARGGPFGATTILIPTAGRYHVRSGGQEYTAAPGASALLLSGNNALAGLGLDYAGVAFNIDNARLAQVASAMKGGRQVELGLDDERELSLNALYRIGLGANLQGLLTQIDAASKVPGLADLLGLEDLLYRHVALLLAPSSFVDDTASHTGSRIPRGVVMAICDRIEAALPATIRLSDLEAVSGFSARAVQYAFKRHLGCSPAEWIRERRLARVHTRLMTPRPGETVTSIAFAEGFFHMGDFSRRFNQRYGLLPSVMLARTRGHG